MQNATQLKVLIAPLDWGLGHASRCVPIVRALLHMGAQVTLAASGNALKLLQAEFPTLPTIELKGYDVRYPNRGSWLFHFIKRLPTLVYYLYKEKKQSSRIIKKLGIDLVISDNRYFVRSRSTYSICISHQLHPPFPFAKSILNRFNHYLLNRFDEVWVPDNATSERLAGELSAPVFFSKATLHYIGPLSRFNYSPAPTTFKYDFMALISGPEPQRSALEKMLCSQLKTSEKKGLMVLGLPGTSTEFETGKYDQIRVISHLDGKDIATEMAASRLVICRSGYTSIMELVALQKQAILIPTPTQPEQAYLGNYLKNSGPFLVVEQHEFDFDKHYETASTSLAKKTLALESQTLEKHIARCFDKLTRPN